MRPSNVEGHFGARTPVPSDRTCVICLDRFFGFGRFCEDYPCKELAKKHGSDVEAMRTAYEKWITGRVKVLQPVVNLSSVKAAVTCRICNRKLGPYGCQVHR